MTTATSISPGVIAAITLAAVAALLVLLTTHLLTQRHQRLLPATHHRLSSRLATAFPLEPTSSHRLSFGARSALAQLHGPLALDHLAHPSSTFPGAHSLYRPRAFSPGSDRTSSSNSEPDSAWQTIASATTRTHTTAHATHGGGGGGDGGFRRLHSAMTRAAATHNARTSTHNAAITAFTDNDDTTDQAATAKRFSAGTTTSTRSAYALEFGAHFDRSTPPQLPPVDFEVARPVEGVWMTPIGGGVERGSGL